MHFLRFILIPALLLATNANGQSSNLNKLVRKTFVSRTLEYLEILNDTTLYSSINSYTDTAKFFLRNDTLFIKQRYLQTDQTGTKWIDRLYDYKVISLSYDTLRLINNYRFNYRPANWEDTLFLVNIEKLKEPVTDFRFLKLDFSSPWSGAKQVTIDSSGKVTFIDDPIPYSINHPNADKNAKPKNMKGQLTPNEFANFKNLLSKSLPSRLPIRRGCPIDGATSDFDITIGTKRIKSIGCDLSWTHAFFLNYIYGIDQNKGLIKKTN
jgi:hypothetical protein